MENELKIEHLAPYLPYGLRFSLSKSRGEFICTGLTVEDDGIMAHNIKGCCNVSLGSYYKPILRPLSDFVTHDIFKVVANSYETIKTNANGGVSFYIDGCFEHDISYYPYEVVVMLLKNQFDVFGLVPSGLAIDINTLNEPK